MSEPILSVIVPIYNVENYLEQCLESIINQTYRNLEIILVDDGSTDNSGKIADNYQKKDNRIKVIHKENGGLISSRYTGVSVASSEYCTFVDSDDWIKPNMYEVLMARMIKFSVDMVTSGCIRYYTEDRQYVSYDKLILPGVYDVERIKKSIIPIMLNEETTDAWALDPSTCFKIYKRDKLFPILEKLKNESFYFGEDTAITYSYVLVANSIFCTNEIFYYHRHRMSGEVASYLIKKGYYRDLLAVYEYLYDAFSGHELEKQLIKQLDYFFIRSTRNKQLKYENFTRAKNIYYLFPFDKIKANSKMVIYGAGKVGQDYIYQLNKIPYGDVVLWVDKNYSQLGEEVRNPEMIMCAEFDYIIVAIAQEDAVKEVRAWLLSKGVDKGKIVHCALKCQCK